MLKISGLNVTLGKKEILKDINLTLDERFVAFTGPNGGGKSTLAKVIAGIIKPTEGKIYFNGEDITDLSITERAQRGISYAFQQPVRFKGIQVLDLLRLEELQDLGIAEALAASLEEAGGPGEQGDQYRHIDEEGKYLTLFQIGFAPYR